MNDGICKRGCVDAQRGGEPEPRPQPVKGIVQDNKMESQYLRYLFFYCREIKIRFKVKRNDSEKSQAVKNA